SEAKGERTEQPIAQRHDGVEVILDRWPKTGELRPLVDAVQRLARLDVGIVGGQAGADVEALLQVRLVARIDRLVQWRVTAIVAVDAHPQSLLGRQPKECRGGRERALDRCTRNAVIDQLEGAPARERRLEIACHCRVGVRLTADDRGETDNRNAHVWSFFSKRGTRPTLPISSKQIKSGCWLRVRKS